MFALPSQAFHQQQSLFRSFTPLPFTSIDHNARPFSMNPSKTIEQPNKSKPPSFKHAPIRPSSSVKPSSQRRDLRNAVLLKGVKERRQIARDDLRSEYILRSDILAEQRAWEAAQQMEAAKWTVREEDEDAMDERIQEAMQDDAELEEMLAREQAEIEARATEEEEAARVQSDQKNGYGSDDDMDMLLLQVAEEWERDMDLS